MSCRRKAPQWAARILYVMVDDEQPPDMCSISDWVTPWNHQWTEEERKAIEAGASVIVSCEIPLQRRPGFVMRLEE